MLPLLVAWAPPTSEASEEPAGVEGEREPGYRLWLDGTATAITGGFFLVTGALPRWTAPKQCRWCGVGSFDLGARGALEWNDTYAAARLSDLGTFGYVPALSLILHAAGVDKAGAWKGTREDYRVIVEALAITGAITNAAKIGFARERPYAHFSESQLSFRHHPDQNLGFFSGHTSLAFAMVTATGTVASLRRLDTAPWIWGVGIPLAAASGYLRVAGDRHYLTDVLVGAFAGTAVGVAVPLIVHRASPRWRPRRIALRLVPSPNGLGLVGRW